METRKFDINEDPHRRWNPLLDEWVLVSPHRAKRPWQGQKESLQKDVLPKYDSSCYLCPTNVRANGVENPNYEDCYVFDNDFAALKPDEVHFEENKDQLFRAKPEQGISRVVCFSPQHDLTLPEMELSAIEKIIRTWQREYEELGKIEYINYVQIFENKGAVMGCSNPHPHGQIWAQSSLPTLVSKTQNNLLAYYEKNGSSLLQDYLEKELQLDERIVINSDYYVAMVPYWAIWPFETLVLPKRKVENISLLTADEVKDYAKVLQTLTIKYDNLFECSFPYSSGIHQAPTDGKLHPEWHLHMHFYPPLLRSASVKKFMVGYEMMGESQRDITPEKSAAMLRELPAVHYKKQ